MAEDAKPGHNAPKKEEVMSFISRIERLAEQKKDISEDIKEVKKEASQAGITTKSLNEILRLRKLQRDMGRDAYTEWHDEVEVLTDSLGQAFWNFEQGDLEDAASEPADNVAALHG